MDSDKAKLFVGGISRDTSEDVLKIHFSRYGAISGSLVAKDKITGCPRGFGFVSFCDPSCADKALQDTHVIQGRTVEVKKAIPRSEQHHYLQQHHQHQHQHSQQRSRRNNDYFRTKKIFVGGLSATLTVEQFRNYFERFGRITDVVVMQDSSTNRPRGFGFVTFDSEESVDKVLLKTYHDLNGRSVEVKRAVPKDGSNGSSNSYVGGGSVRVSNSSPQPESYPSYGTGYEFLSGYSAVPVYDGYGGYAYGTGVFNGGYPMVRYGRPSFGVIPVAPRSPWTGPMVIGTGAFPFQYPDSSLCASYMNDGISLAGLAVNGYNGIVGIGMHGKLNHVLGVNGHLPPVSIPPLVNGVKLQTNSPDPKAHNGVATS